MRQKIALKSNWSEREYEFLTDFDAIHANFLHNVRKILSTILNPCQALRC